MREEFAWPGIAARTVAVYEAARAHDAGAVAREAESVLAGRVPGTRPVAAHR